MTKPDTTRRIPLVVGITGHRDVPDQDQPILRLEIERLIDLLTANRPHTTLLLLTSLAEGADRIGAHAFIDAGHRIGAILPFESAEYEKDFESLASKEEYFQLKSSADFCVTVEYDPKQRPDLDRRNALYFSAGCFVADHASILVAAWDGQVVQPAVGTNAIVAWALPADAEFPSSTLPNETPSIPRSQSLSQLPAIFLIPTNRQRNRESLPKSEAYRGRWLTEMKSVEQ